jgi:hypothetical protein
MACNCSLEATVGLKFPTRIEPALSSMTLLLSLRSYSPKSIRSFDRFVHVLCGRLELTQWQRGAVRQYAGTSRRYSFLFENLLRSVIRDAVNEQIVKNQRRRMQTFYEVATVQREPMAVRTSMRLDDCGDVLRGTSQRLGRRSCD